MRPVPAIVNRASGNAEAALAVLRADQRVCVRDVVPASIAVAVADHVAQGAERVVVAGGDGTLASAAAALVSQPTALAIMPAGTLNHFAQDLGIPTDLKRALEIALGGPKAQVGVGFVNQRLFLNTSSVGAYVVFVRSREWWRRRLGYYLASAVAAVRTFLALRNFTVELEVNGAVRRFHSPLVFIGVGERQLHLPKLGARKEAGRRGFHLLIVRRTTRLGLLSMAMRALVKGVRIWGGERDVESMIVQKCRIVLKRPQVRVATDGEIAWFHGPLEYAYQPNVLTVAIPEPA